MELADFSLAITSNLSYNLGLHLLNRQFVSLKKNAVVDKQARIFPSTRVFELPRDGSAAIANDADSSHSSPPRLLNTSLNV